MTLAENLAKIVDKMTHTSIHIENNRLREEHVIEHCFKCQLAALLQQHAAEQRAGAELVWKSLSQQKRIAIQKGKPSLKRTKRS